MPYPQSRRCWACGRETRIETRAEEGLGCGFCRRQWDALDLTSVVRQNAAQLQTATARVEDLLARYESATAAEVLTDIYILVQLAMSKLQ